jgi:thiamine biosynthesis lipoprotein
MKNKEFRAMGTNVEIIVNEPNDQVDLHIDRAIQMAQEKMLSLESLLSRFREDSEISRINAAMGHWIDVSPDTMEILRIAQDAFARTHGFFNPFMGLVLERLGYNVTFEDIERNADQAFTFDIPFVPPIHSPLQIDENALRARIEPGYKIDLGGIAKGWIVEQAATVLIKHGISNFICNAGGDLVCRGSNDGMPWVVGITDPFDPLKTVVNLDVTNMCIATSGTYLRKWSAGAREVHHIIDPFFGYPVQTDIMSCTVIHQSLVEAEILAKIALILGTAEGIPWLEKQSMNGWVIVKNDGEVKRSCNL